MAPKSRHKIKRFDGELDGEEDYYLQSLPSYRRAIKHVSKKIRQMWEEERSLTKVLFGIFDIFLLALTLVDAVSDVMVGLEFRDKAQNEDPRWNKFFWAVAVCFTLGSISDCVGFLISMERRFRLDRAWEWIFYVTILLPFSQLLPIINYLQSMFDPEFHDFAAHDKVNWDEALDDMADRQQQNEAELSSASDALKMQAAAAAKTSAVAAVDRAVQARHAAFLTLNISAVVESLPMCVIQLIACSAMEESNTISPTMTFSLALSLFSVTIKAFQLCRSFEIATIAAKFALMSFDVMATAFVCCSLFSGPRNATWHVPLLAEYTTVEVSTLSWYWLTLKFYNVLSIAAVTVGICTVEIVREGRRRSYGGALQEQVRLACIFASMFILAPVPLAIMQETVKLSWYVALNLSSQPQPDAVPSMPLLHHFLHDNAASKAGTSAAGVANKSNDEDGVVFRDTTDWVATFNALLQLFEDELRAAQRRLRMKMGGGHPDVNAGDSISFPAGRFSGQRQRQRRFGATDLYWEFTNNFPRPEALFRRCQKPLDAPVYRRDDFATRARFVTLYHYFERACGLHGEYYNAHGLLRGDIMTHVRRNFDSKVLPHVWKLAAAQQKYTLLDYVCQNLAGTGWHPAKSPPRANVQYSSSGPNWAESIGLVVIIFFTVCTSLFGAAYPVLHFVGYFLTGAVSYTPIQLICIVPCLLALAVIVCLVPTIVRYELTCSLQSFALKRNVKNVSKAVDSFFSLPLLTLCSSAIPSQALPRDACEHHLLKFLDQKMVGLYGVLPGAEFDRMKREFEKEV